VLHAGLYPGIVEAAFLVWFLLSSYDRWDFLLAYSSIICCLLVSFFSSIADIESYEPTAYSLLRWSSSFISSFENSNWISSLGRATWFEAILVVSVTSDSSPATMAALSCCSNYTSCWLTSPTLALRCCVRWARRGGAGFRSFDSSISWRALYASSYSLRLVAYFGSESYESLSYLDYWFSFWDLILSNLAFFYCYFLPVYFCTASDFSVGYCPCLCSLLRKSRVQEASLPLFSTVGAFSLPREASLAFFSETGAFPFFYGLSSRTSTL